MEEKKRTKYQLVQPKESIKELGKVKAYKIKKKLVVEPQTLKGITEQYLNLKIKQQNKQFETLVNSRVIKNHISPKIVKRLGILY